MAEFIKQYADGRTLTAWQIAVAVAAEIGRLGYHADARKGPAATSPDDEPTVHCAHVVTTDAGWAAYQQSRAAAKAAK
jgi:hypothetical protein